MRKPHAVIRAEARPDGTPHTRAPQLLGGFTPTASDLGHSQGVHDSWREYFRHLPSGARLLEIAAGIGPLALIAQEVSQAGSRRFEVHSLDQASTLDAEPLSLNGIRFHARRYDRSTPFEDGYFDAISAQWAPPDDGGVGQGLTELRRILKSGGRARFMFHALGGAAHQQCLERMRTVELLLDKLQLLEHARHMFEAIFTVETALKRDAMRSAMMVLDTQQIYVNTANWAAYLMRDTPNPKAGEQILQLINDCWERRQSLGHVEIMAQLDRVEGEMRAAQERMQAACALAVDETRVHRIGRLFKATGFERVKVRPFKIDDALIAWDLTAA
jgi:SAM-dependent methyltransferase